MGGHTGRVTVLAMLALAACAPTAAAQQEPLSDYGQSTPEGEIKGKRQAATSRLDAPTGCVQRTVLLTVRGRGISRVVWSVNGRRRATTRPRDGRTRFRLRAANPGVYRVAARVVYRATTGARAVTRRTVVQRCRSAQLPTFTG